MSAILQLNKETRRIYKKHFLSSVHAEIRYQTINISKLNENLDKLKKALSKHGFKNCHKIFEEELKFDTKKNKTPKMKHNVSNQIGLIFSSLAPNRQLKMFNNKITISDMEYDGFESFSKRFKTFWHNIQPLLGLSKNAKIERVGLRKINTIKLESVSSLQDVLKIFNHALFGIARSGLFSKDYLNVTEDVTALESKEKLCLIRTLLKKLEDQDSFEATLDFDIISLMPSKMNDVFKTILPSLNDEHFDLFRWSVTKQMIQLMEKE